MIENVENVSNLECDYPETLTVKEVQSILRLGKNAVYNLMHSHSFPVIKIGGSIRIPKEPFYEWLNQSHVVNY